MITIRELKDMLEGLDEDTIVMVSLDGTDGEYCVLSEDLEPSYFMPGNNGEILIDEVAEDDEGSTASPCVILYPGLVGLPGE